METVISSIKALIRRLWLLTVFAMLMTFLGELREEAMVELKNMLQKKYSSFQNGNFLLILGYFTMQFLDFCFCTSIS